MLEIRCLVCDRKIKVPQYVDSNDYKGQLYCRECQLLLDIELVEEKVKKYKVAVKQTKPRPANIKIITSIPRPNYEKTEGGVKHKGDS
jgi:transcription elongation factor Elf1